MNVLILTPDAVGSTLLQRLLTVYMQFHEFDRPVINVHELTNGLDHYFSPEFNQEIITRHVKHHGYYQFLSQIIDILESVNHYKTARLAQYHIVQRQDSVADQLPFYQYLNDNFYIIACRRENLFEHTISHVLNSITKKLNVYTPLEKLHSFYGLYQRGFEVQTQQIHYIMDRYRDYLTWTSRHFVVGSYFSYETHLPDIEKYILSLPIFGRQQHLVTWDEKFNMTFDDWNRCHYYHSDIGSIIRENNTRLIETSMQDSDNAALPIEADRLQDRLPLSHQQFIQQHHIQYQQANDCINQMQHLGILVSGIPIKKQTLEEKLMMIRNLDQCVAAFNHWCSVNPGVSDPVDADQLKRQAKIEYKNWDSKQSLTLSAPA